MGPHLRLKNWIAKSRHALLQLPTAVGKINATVDIGEEGEIREMNFVQIVTVVKYKK